MKITGGVFLKIFKKSSRIVTVQAPLNSYGIRLLKALLDGADACFRYVFVGPVRNAQTCLNRNPGYQLQPEDVRTVTDTGLFRIVFVTFRLCSLNCDMDVTVQAPLNGYGIRP